MAGLSLELHRPKTLINRYRPRAKPARPRPTGLDRRVVKIDSLTNISQPPAEIIVKHMNPAVTCIDEVKKCIATPRAVTNDTRIPKSRVAMSNRSRPRPIIGQRHRPVVPITPRCNSTLTSIVGFGEEFSSTTIVSGASQGEPTIFHGPLKEYKSPTKSHPSNPHIDSQDMWNANSLSHTNEIILETLEVPVEALISEDNEIQTIHIGDFSNVGTSDNTNPATEETFIASTDASGKCVVTVQQPKTQKKTQTHCFPQPTNPIKVTTCPVRAEGESSPKSCRVRVVGFGRSRMIADYQTNIPVTEYKAQLNDTSDIIGKLEIAPPTKRLMQLQNKSNNRYFKTEGAAQLLTNSGRPFSSCLFKYFVRHLTTRPVLLEETFPDMELLPVGYTRTVDLTKIKRITRKRFYPEAEEYQRKLANEQLQLRFENFVTENEGMQTEFLQEEEEILPDYHVTDPIFVEGSLANFDQEVHEEVMCLYDDGTVVDTESASVESQHTRSDSHRSTIIMVHQEEQFDDPASFTPKNIEVLLAAAEKQGVSRKNIQQVIFCQPAGGEEQHIMVMPVDSLVEELNTTGSGTT